MGVYVIFLSKSIILINLFFQYIAIYQFVNTNNICHMFENFFTSNIYIIYYIF